MALRVKYDPVEDPDRLIPPDPNDPLPDVGSIALKLGECRSVSHLIPKAVLEK